MLHVTFRRVGNAEAEEVRKSLSAMRNRAAEVEEALRQESSSEEVCYLLPPSDEHLLVFASWLADPDRASSAFAASRLPVDIELKEIFAKASPGPAAAQTLYRVAVDGER